MQNREIKFRGFDKLHNTWVYGDLIRIPTDGGDYNTPPSSELTTYVTNSHVLTHEWVDVDPNSVGQFTGLHDKNGKTIYEGDIVNCGTSGTFQIVFQNGKFVATYMDDSGDEIDGDMWREMRKSIIIGNLYENQDLLT